MNGTHRAGLLALLALGACADATGSDQRLRAEDVAGIYDVCALVFRPENPTQPAADIRAAAFETANPQVRQPQLALDVEPRAMALLFTRRGQFVPQELRGSYDLSGSSQVVLRFPRSTGPSSLLLPETLRAEFGTGPMTISAAPSEAYSVPRADYARLAGVSEAGLAEQIPGRLTARFVNGPCS